MVDEEKPPRIEPLTEEGKARIERVLEQALRDISFRELLLENPNEALKDTDLTNQEKIMLHSLHRVALEEWGLDVRKYRAYLRDNGFKVGPE